jgi:hypothetical protein
MASNLRITYEYLLQRVSDFIGLGSSTPTGSNLTLVGDIVARGYRQFLYPVDMRTGDAYEWSFLRKLFVLPIKSAKWKYQLPEDFSEILSDPSFDDDDGYKSLNKITPQEMFNLRSGVVESSFPYYYAVVPVEGGLEVGTFDEMWLYPEPDASYNLKFFYKIDPLKPDTITHYLIGGVKATEAILESCLAVAEVQEDDTIGIHTQKAEELIQKLILVDSKRDEDTIVGNLYHDYSRFLVRDHRGYQDMNDVYPGE